MPSLIELGTIAQKFRETATTTLKMTKGYERFLQQGTPDELLALLNAEAGHAGPMIGLFTRPRKQGPAHHIWVAEIFAGIAERTGQSDRLAQCLPTEARDPAVIGGLTEHAPALARLCAGKPLDAALSKPPRVLLN